MENYLLKIVIILLIFLDFSETKAETTAPECVVLLHGLARTERSMIKLEHYLEDNDFIVMNIAYPSRKKTVQELSDSIVSKAVAECRAINAGKIHFVTHSLGGILVRYYLEYNEVPELGRVVMLSPPNNGSEVVDKLKDILFFKWLNGPAGEQLGTDQDDLPKNLVAPYYDVGIITGDRSINPILSFLIPGKDDGKVSIESAKLDGMTDFVIVHKAHPFIMRDEEVFQLIVTFIRNGMFSSDKTQIIQ